MSRSLRGPAVFAILDQSVVSGTHFALNIVLARWLRPDDYGAFAVGFAVFLVASGFLNALLLEPMQVFGPLRAPAERATYLGHLVLWHALLNGALGLGLFVATVLTLPLALPLGHTLLGLSVALPFILLFWLLRQSCYVDTRPHLALLGSGAYALVALLLLVLLRGTQSPERLLAWTFPALGVAGLLASLVLGHRLAVRITLPKNREARHALVAVFRQHWGYGRYILAASILHGIGFGLYVPMVAAALGLAEGGAFRALQNLVLPLQQVQVGIGMLAVPWLSGERARRGEARVGSAVRRLGIVSLAVIGIYNLPILLLGQPIVDLLYGRGVYAAPPLALAWLVAAGSLVAITQTLGVAVRAFARAETVLSAKLAGLVCLLPALPLTWTWGIPGAFAGLACGALAESAALLWGLRKQGMTLRGQPLAAVGAGPAA